MLWRKYGLEMEFTGITRKRAAELLEEQFGTTAAYSFEGNKYRVTDARDRGWSVLPCPDVRAERWKNSRMVGANYLYQVKVSTPLLYESDFETVEKILRRLESGAARIADLAACMMCGLDKSCTYNGILTEMREGYKPYQDKQKLTARLQGMKKGIDDAQNAQDRHSLFCCLKSVADMALRLTVYLQTDYAIEMERRNSFQKQEKPPPETVLEESAALKPDLKELNMAWQSIRFFLSISDFQIINEISFIVVCFPSRTLSGWTIRSRDGVPCGELGQSPKVLRF